MLKDKICNYLLEKTSCLKNGEPDEVLTAREICKVFAVKRNTASHYLNKMVASGEAIKINSRPVYFLHKSAFEACFFRVSKSVYSSRDELFSEKEEHDTIFKNLIGISGSLKEGIDQIKTAIYYPPNGLPVMLTGPSGVGKSHMAFLVHQFCIQQEVLSQDAPFLTLNCAQYSNNPELLSSNLFGYEKGAYTGADERRIGMLEAADNGVLFLDEVHRLNSEGQEKLFTFMDKGRFRRMGESEGWHESNVRLVFATTESLPDTFLDTFLRRVPVFVALPGLKERGESEKIQFAYQFLINEARTFKKTIHISKQSIDLLLAYEFPGNIGEMQSTIKYICALAYSKNRNDEHVMIRMKDLPEKLLKEALDLRGMKISKNSEIIVYPDSTLNDLGVVEKTSTEVIEDAYRNILDLFNDYSKKNDEIELFENSIFREIHVLLDRLFFETPHRNDSIVLRYMIANLQEVFRYLETGLNTTFNGDSIYTIAYFLYTRSYEQFLWSKEEKQSIAQLHAYILSEYEEANRIFLLIIQLISSKMEISLSKEDEIFLTMFIRSLNIEESNLGKKGVILAHGYATASSISNIANRMLQRNIFEAFDMPMDISVDEIALKLIEYIDNHDVSEGLIILVDMGSLKDIYTRIEEAVSGPVMIINNVSTQTALHVGDLIRKDIPLEEMSTKIKAVSKTDCKVIYPQRQKKNAIVTTCATGIGTAKKLQMLLRKSIPDSLGIEIVVQDFDRLKANGLEETLFQYYNVLAIVGTVNPDIDNLSFISLEELISGDGEKKLERVLVNITNRELVQEINDSMIRYFSLESVVGSLTIIDMNKIMGFVEQFFKDIEFNLGKRLPNDKKIALYVHVSCLVERLIRHEPIENYPDMEHLPQCQRDMLKIIENAFTVIAEGYNVKINLAELCYIYDIMTL